MILKPKLKRTAMICAPAIALALGGPAFASGANVDERAAQPGVAMKQTQRTANQLEASRLIGMDVIARTGETVGEVEDVVIDLSDGRARYAVISSGGFLDIGDRHYVFRLDQLSTAGSDELILEGDAELVRTAPSFDSDGWPAFDAQIWENLAADPATETDLRRVSELLGLEVKSPAGVHVGEIEEFMIDLRDGSARAILEYEPEDGDERMVAVPPSRLGIPRDSDEAVINMSQAELMRAPLVNEGT